MERNCEEGWVGTGFAVLTFLILSVIITSMASKIILNSNRSIDAAREKQAYWNVRVGHAVSNQITDQAQGRVAFGGGEVFFDDLCKIGQSGEVMAGGGLITLLSNDFNNDETLADTYRSQLCSGQDNSPQLNWTGVPVDAASLVIIVSDADANNFTHWSIYNIPVATTLLNRNANVPSGATELVNYVGPCPPIDDGINHRYVFKIYALDADITGSVNNIADLRIEMDGKVIACGQITGRYERSS